MEGGGHHERVAVDCFYWWQPWPVCPGDDGGVERETQWRGDNTNIDFHLSAGVEQDIFTPPGPGPGLPWWWSLNITPVGGEGGGPPTPSLPIPSATVCNYVRLLGLTPGFSSSRKGQLRLRIKVLLFSSTV